MASIRSRGFFLGIILVLASGCGDDGEGALAPPSRIQQGTQITLADGMVQGEVAGATRRFRGIPFAAPPVGNLRWRSPQPVKPWSGVLDATHFGPACPQIASLTSDASEEEDCLQLNVWTPDPAPLEPLPVMVWFHGGGNESGSTADPVPFGIGDMFYNGQGLVELANVVVVTTNYRLGVMGFFTHPVLSAEDRSRPYSGNQGLLDQHAALEWVRDNIGAFGGDPDNVTIFGESAGSFDTCFHVASPQSRGLFHRAISESGGCTTRQTTGEQAEINGEVFADAVGCGDAADVLACLRNKPVADLLVPAPVDGAAEGDVPGGDYYRGGTPRWSFGPIVDGAYMPDQPRSLFERGDVARVPYILGSNTDEGSLFHIGAAPVTNEEEYLAALERRFGDRAQDIAELYPLENFELPNDAIVRVTGDAFLACSTYDSALRAAAAGSDVFMYNFARPVPIPALAPLRLGATHGVEIAYVFGSVTPGVAPEEYQLSEIVRGYWGRFATTGDPNGAGAVAWPRFGSDSNRRLNINLPPSVVDDFRRAECEFWRTLYDEEFAG